MEEKRNVPELRIVRMFDAPRALVFRQWTDPLQLMTWFAPDGYTCTDCQADVRLGGRWHVEYRSDQGEVHVESGEFRAIVANEKLELSLTQQDRKGNVGPETIVSLSFASKGARTEMTFVQTGYESDKQRDGNAAGWNECFGKIDRQLAAEQELRALFDAWFNASQAKDIEGSMAPIATNVLAYEHEQPLQHSGIAALREICQAGLDAATDKFRWDVPDMKIIIRGDIAVTWGLNRMHFEPAGKPASDSWSRGTRIFQRLGGRWQMIHQHVSYPMDPESGKASTDLKP